jgi:hypothetical protein
MDALIGLAREFDTRRISLMEFREHAIDALAAMSADQLMEFAQFFSDVEADNYIDAHTN